MFRGNTTYQLNANATALEVKRALEALPVINTVNVHRNPISIYGAFVLLIEFLSVNRLTPFGYVEQPIGS
jgi:hypothetical protein